MGVVALRVSWLPRLRMGQNYLQLAEPSSEGGTKQSNELTYFSRAWPQTLLVPVTAKSEESLTGLHQSSEGHRSYETITLVNTFS
jgi:hypothetical protein